MRRKVMEKKKTLSVKSRTRSENYAVLSRHNVNRFCLGESNLVFFFLGGRENGEEIGGSFFVLFSFFRICRGIDKRKKRMYNKIKTSRWRNFEARKYFAIAK